MSWIDRYFAVRDRWLSNPKFQRWAASFPLTRPTARRRARALFDVCAGFVYSQILFACVRLKLFDLLAEAPLTAADISARLKVPLSSTERLLEAAVSLRLVDRRPAGRFGLGSLGAALVGNPAVGAMVEHHSLLYADLHDPVGLLRGEVQQTQLAKYWTYTAGEKPSSRGSGPRAESDPAATCAGRLADGTVPAGILPEGTVREGTVPGGTLPAGTFPEATGPAGTFPEAAGPAGTFPEAAGPAGTLPAGRSTDYTSLMSNSQPLVSDEILDAYPLNKHRCLLDVGGGDGTFLIEAARRYKNLRVTLFDLPPVARRAAQRFDSLGLQERARVFGGDFLSEPLPDGSDVVSLVRVVHDHDDAVAMALLRAAHRALPPKGVLLLAEPMMGTPGAEPVADAYFGFYLLAMGRGRPRTPQELQQMLHSAGFAGTQVLRTRQPLQSRLIVARKSHVADAHTSESVILN